MGAISQKGAEFLVRSRIADAERGDVDALFELGVTYSTGRGGQPVDLVEAHKWFNLAALSGCSVGGAVRTDAPRTDAPPVDKGSGPAVEVEVPPAKASVASPENDDASAAPKASGEAAARPPPIFDGKTGVRGGCCKGMNECKGKGMCKTDRNDCKGMNQCKGQGGCKPVDCSNP